jgi:hypothetical protein
MMGLILAPNFMEGIEEKFLKSQEHKIGQKYSENHRKRKRVAQLETGFNHKDQLY